MKVIFFQERFCDGVYGLKGFCRREIDGEIDEINKGKSEKKLKKKGEGAIHTREKGTMSLKLAVGVVCRCNRTSRSLLTVKIV